jgi:fluoroquinolone transport system permease protein
MNELLAMLKWEFILQSRYRIIYIAFGSVILYYLMLEALPILNSVEMSTTFLFFDPMLIGIMFVGALVLFEKTENTLQALVVTPMKTNTYFLSKIISLTILSLLTGTLFLLLTQGIDFSVPHYLIGVALTSILLILIGFIFVSRCQSLNEYLLMIMLSFVVLFLPPLLHTSGIYENPLFYLWPTQASFIMMKGTFTEISVIDTAYAASYLIIWIVLCFYLAKKAFYKYIVQGGM